MFGIDNVVDAIFTAATDRISRTERVIKLLKQFNLNPDHPPADFTGVYQYALVEYGIDKPRYVLEIFRQSQIQQLFRTALEQNNPTVLLQQGEALLQETALGAEIQANQVDIRREFYEFAAVFIAVAKRTRTPAEILAEQKLESLHHQLRTLHDRLNRLPTLEGMRTEMARLALPSPATRSGQALPPSPVHSHTPSPPYSPTATLFALAQQIRGWFETLGFPLETHEVWQDDYFEWIINIPVRRGRYDRILVRGIDGEAGLRDVDALKRSVETHRTDEGWLVTARRISRAARDEVEKAENDGLGCYTLDELLDQDADFSGYLTWLEAEIQKRGIAEKYVPLACLKEEIDPETQQRIGVSRYDDRDGWIDGYIDLWLDDPAKEHISVLGEFGTGKTWFALHYAWKALQRYRDAQRRGLERPRLPLVIPLRDYAKAVSVESLFSEFFFRKHEIPIPGYSAFEQLNRMGKLLLIFDGFDEMAARVNRQEMINNFWELAKVVVPGAKVILTCRTEHFPEAREGRALLNAELQASTRDLTGETPQFEVLELEKFNDGQIRQVLSHQAQSATVEQIMGNPQLLDLARRPVLTELILEALPDIEAGKPVDMSRVYLYAVRHKMERDIKAERTFTSMADKLYFMCELSWEMLSTDRMSINYREFPDRIRKLFGPAVQEEKDLDHWHYDMMGQTMLIRNAAGDYTPAHRSFLEFFATYKLLAELGVLAADFIEIAQQQSHLATSAPQTYIWPEYFTRHCDSSGNVEPIAPLQTFEYFDSSRTREFLAELPLTKAILELCIPMLDQSIMTEKLVSLIQTTRGQSQEEAGYFGGNLAQMLVGANYSSLENADLSQTVLMNADFSNASLRDANFADAVLTDAIFAKPLGGVASTAFSPNGELLAIGDEYGTIYIIEATSKRVIFLVNGHQSWVWSMAFSPDGRLLATCSSDCTLKLWSVEQGICINIFEGHKDRIRAVVFSPDSNLLLTGASDNTIKIWSISQGTCLATLEDHENWVLSIAFSPNGQFFATGSYDHTLKLWSSESYNCLHTFRGHTDKIWSVDFSPNGKLLATASQDRTVRLWSVEDLSCIKTLSGHQDWLFSVQFSPDGTLLATSSEDETVKLWSVADGICLKTLKEHQHRVFSAAFSPDSKSIVTASDDQTVRFWSISEGICLTKLEGYHNSIWAAKFSPDGQLLATGGDDKILKIWSVENGECLKLFSGHKNWIVSLDFSADGQLLATGSSDKTARIWSVKDGTCIKTLKGHDLRVFSVSFSPDNQILATGSGDQTVKLWSVKEGDCIKTLKGHSNRIYAVSFSSNGQLLATGSRDETVKIWSVSSGVCLHTLEGHSDKIWAVSFSPDGKFLLTGSTDRTAKLWSLAEGACIQTLSGHKGSVRSVAFSPNGKLLATSSYDKTIKLWSAFTGNCINTLEGHENSVWSIAFSPDGEYLASSSDDQTIRVWSLASGLSKLVIADKLYSGLNITNSIGLNSAQNSALHLLGARERE